MTAVFIGLGSNIDQPVKQVQQALKSLALLPETESVSQSSLYSSPPMGPQDQPDYINAVAQLETTLEPHDLLNHLQAIENEQGRIRKRHWGERCIDLDLLVYGNRIINDERLAVPHAGLAERSFVLQPLIEIAPDLVIPQQGAVSVLMQHCTMDAVTKRKA